MYAGNMVEFGDIKIVFNTPSHPYTKALLGCIPHIGMKKGTLSAIDGNVPSVGTYPSGCRYHPRCPYAFEPCKKRIPELIRKEGETQVACHLFQEIKD